MAYNTQMFVRLHIWWNTENPIEWLEEWSFRRSTHTHTHMYSHEEAEEEKNATSF